MSNLAYPLHGLIVLPESHLEYDGKQDQFVASRPLECYS